MGKIKVLPNEVIKKIAAGEVIERPASVVKELIENSLDAGSSRITVRIKNGGKRSIRVTDNGEGMSSADLPLSLKRHATSKLRDIEGLNTIRTLGFRGEALPSIAAVSEFRILSRTSLSRIGYRLSCVEDSASEVREEGAPLGTQVTAENLFYNLPVRKKFLKSDETEKNHVLRTVQDYALVNHSFSFLIEEDNRNLLGPLPENQTFIERISSLFGSSIVKELIPIESANEVFKISGFITRTGMSYPNRSHQYIFVNGRSIRSRLIYSAVTEGYKTLLPQRRFPGVFLKMHIDPSQIDVNVHPAKLEIKFINESAIYSLLSQTIIKSLQGESGLSAKDTHIFFGKDDAQVRKTMEVAFPELREHSSKISDISRINEKSEKSFTVRSEQEKDKVEPLCQIESKYIVAHDREAVLIIDQHAAWERILYEAIKEEFLNDKIQSQLLLVPLSIEVPPSLADIISHNLAFFKQLGFDIGGFGKNAFLVSSAPVVFGRIQDKSVLTDIISEIADSDLKKKTGDKKILGEINDAIFKKMACRGRELAPSIMAGDSLNYREMKEILNRLFSCRNMSACPHGRPTMIRFLKSDIEKRFGRPSAPDKQTIEEF